MVNIRFATQRDAKAIAKVHVDSWRTTYDGIIADKVLDGLSYEQRETNWASGLMEPENERCIYVAENDAGNVIGFACGGRERTGNYPDYGGELYAIYLFKDYQGKKVGLHLLQEVAKDLSHKGMNAMLVWVLERNPSRYFYESLHPVQVDKQKTTIGGNELDEIAYGWKDAAALLQR